jgi:hypothetical protein
VFYAVLEFEAVNNFGSPRPDPSMRVQWPSRRTLGIIVTVLVVLFLVDHTARVTGHPSLRPIRPLQWLADGFVDLCSSIGKGIGFAWVKFWTQAESIGLAVINKIAPWATWVKVSWTAAWDFARSIAVHLWDIYSPYEVLVTAGDHMAVFLKPLHGLIIVVDWQRFVPQFTAPEWVARSALAIRNVIALVVPLTFVVRMGFEGAKPHGGEEGNTPKWQNPVDAFFVKQWGRCRRAVRRTCHKVLRVVKMVRRSE